MPSVFDCITFVIDVLFFKYVYIFIIVYICVKDSEIIIIEIGLLMYFIQITFHCFNNKVQQKRSVICHFLFMYIMYAI